MIKNRKTLFWKKKERKGGGGGGGGGLVDLAFSSRNKRDAFVAMYNKFVFPVDM
ncbi:MAG: hypothetical protein GY777_32225 [Candidatus Brocadiaceae bacterium]|nr:hypothetical protein [Candidatus Brocadiaceae bacterium]